MIPILIICYNNYLYVKNTLLQLINKNVIIVDNCSTDIDTITFLKNTEFKVIWNKVNNGPWIREDCNNHIYETLPDKFILTDPDLQFNKNLPINYIDILSDLSNTYKCHKIGFALDISDTDKMHDIQPFHGRSIKEIESEYWVNKISNDTYELYTAPLDTTFCLINKNNTLPDIRIAGNFTAKHLPWYIENELFNIYTNYNLYTTTTNISTIAIVGLNYINNNYIQVYKNNENFFIKNNDTNLDFWKNNFHNWENETLCILDKYLDKNSTFIDLGGWVGTTCMYASRKCKHVYVVEADIESLQDLKLNCKNNCDDNITIINNAIYNEDSLEILFGPNQNNENEILNTSTSQIRTIKGRDCYYVKSITLDTIINNYSIKDISLIKVDIEGGEENILEELLIFSNKYNIPIYISFHYTWWNNKNLDRFSLSDIDKNKIINDPFISILFDPIHIYYGTENNKIRVYVNNFIPATDIKRDNLFMDPDKYTKKYIFIENPHDKSISKFSEDVHIKIERYPFKLINDFDKTKKIIIVYYIYINIDRCWKTIIRGQLEDLLKSGILNHSELYIHICCPEYILDKSIEFINNYYQNFTLSNSTQNQYEYPGLKLLYDLAQKNPDSIMFYMHTKGMVFSDFDNQRNHVEKAILRNSIYNYENIIELFKNDNINKIGLFPSEDNFIWFNFFWVRSNYIKIPPKISDDRFYYEHYISLAGFNDKCYSLITNNFKSYSLDEVVYLTHHLPKELNIVNFYFEKIFYGTYFQKIDITDAVLKLCKNNIIYIPGNDFLRNELFSDPVPHFNKYIFIKNNQYSIDTDIYIKDGEVYGIYKLNNIILL